MPEPTTVGMNKDFNRLPPFSPAQIICSTKQMKQLKNGEDQVPCKASTNIRDIFFHLFGQSVTAIKKAKMANTGNAGSQLEASVAEDDIFIKSMASTDSYGKLPLSGVQGSTLNLSCAHVNSPPLDFMKVFFCFIQFFRLMRHTIHSEGLFWEEVQDSRVKSINLLKGACNWVHR